MKGNRRARLLLSIIMGLALVVTFSCFASSVAYPDGDVDYEFKGSFPKGYNQLPGTYRDLDSNGNSEELFPGISLITHLPPTNTGWKIESTYTGDDPVVFTLYIQRQSNGYDVYEITVEGPGSFDVYVDFDQPRGIKLAMGAPPPPPQGSLTITKETVGFTGGVFNFDIFDEEDLTVIYDKVKIDLSEGPSKTIDILYGSYRVIEAEADEYDSVTYTVNGTPVDEDYAPFEINANNAQQGVTILVTNTLDDEPTEDEFPLTKTIGGTEAVNDTFTFNVQFNSGSDDEPDWALATGVDPITITINTADGRSKTANIYDALLTLVHNYEYWTPFRLVETSPTSGYATAYAYYDEDEEPVALSTAFIEFRLSYNDDTEVMLVYAANEALFTGFRVTNTPTTPPSADDEFLLTKTVGGSDSVNDTFTFDIYRAVEQDGPSDEASWEPAGTDPITITVNTASGRSASKDIYNILKNLANTTGLSTHFKLVERAKSGFTTSYRYFVEDGVSSTANAAGIEFWLSYDVEAEELVIRDNSQALIISFEVTNTPTAPPAEDVFLLTKTAGGSSRVNDTFTFDIYRAVYEEGSSTVTRWEQVDIAPITISVNTANSRSASKNIYDILKNLAGAEGSEHFRLVERTASGFTTGYRYFGEGGVSSTAGGSGIEFWLYYSDEAEELVMRDNSQKLIISFEVTNTPTGGSSNNTGSSGGSSRDRSSSSSSSTTTPTIVEPINDSPPPTANSPIIEEAVPLGNLPQTGDAGIPLYLFLILGLSLADIGLAIKLDYKKR